MKSLEFDFFGNRYVVTIEDMASALLADPEQIVAMRKMDSVVEVSLDEGIGEGVTKWIIHPVTGERSGPHSDESSKTEARDNLLYNARINAKVGDSR